MKNHVDGAAVGAPIHHVVLLNWLLSQDVDVTFDFYKHTFENKHIFQKMSELTYFQNACLTITSATTNYTYSTFSIP